MAEQGDNQIEGKENETPQVQFGLQKIYVKDISFEIPNSPMVFQEEWEPSVNMDIANSATKVADNIFEAVLSVTVTVT